MASIQGLAPLAMNLNPYGVNEEVLAPCIRLQIGKLFTSHSQRGRAATKEVLNTQCTTSPHLA